MRFDGALYISAVSAQEGANPLDGDLDAHHRVQLVFTADGP